jgi:hypothetical protein
VTLAETPPPGQEVPDWAAVWLVLRPERLFSYAAERAVP